MILALDSETTGVDFAHGSLPFFVTTCTDAGSQQHWEWRVDPLTRQPEVPSEDIEAIQALIQSADRIVFQGPKFDIRALTSVGITDFPWERAVDTLRAGHLLASNHKHNLTDMVMEYLGVDILPLEVRLRDCVKECRRLARRQYPDWRIAKDGLSEMPSAKGGGGDKDKLWKNDMWLPRALAKELQYPEPDPSCDHEWDKEDSLCVKCGGHLWWVVLAQYSNADSLYTLLLWKDMDHRIKDKGLGAIYRECLKVIPIAYEMEVGGVTINREKQEELKTEFKEESDRLGRICENTAAELNLELTLPKSGNNKSLLTVATKLLDRYDVYDYGEEIQYVRRGTTDSGDLSLSKESIESYISQINRSNLAYVFFDSLRQKRSCDTALSYLESYERFWLPLGEDPAWKVLYPNLHITGTDTLRWSSSQPNSQNISKKEHFNLRRCFGPAPGREWWSLDAKNIELRIAAYISGEQELIALFEQPDEPPYYGSTHLLNFHTVYPDIWDRELREVGLEKVGSHCKKKYAATNYQWCKNGGFKLQYGGVNADSTFHRTGATALVKSRFAKLERLNQKCINTASRKGYVETIPDRRVDPSRGYPLLCTRSERGGIVPTVPLNYMVQGTACWVMMRSMIETTRILRKWSGNPRIVMQIHDEIVVEFPYKEDKGNLPKVTVLKRIMEEVGQDLVIEGIKLPVGVEYHTENWAIGETLA